MCVVKRAVALLFIVFAFSYKVRADSEEYLIPAEEDESCPLGDEIPCGRVIDKNGTLLRYERGNLTGLTNTVPSEDCAWVIRGPVGTRVLLQTTCYHHFYINATTGEYDVCFHVWKDVGSIASSRSCGHGFYKKYHSAHHEENFAVYYKNGDLYALGFSVLVTFTGEPEAELTTTATSASVTSAVESTTSNGFMVEANFSLLVLGFLLQRFLWNNYSGICDN